MNRLRPDSEGPQAPAADRAVAESLIRAKRTNNLREHADRAKREKAEMRRQLEAGEIDPYLLIAGELVEWEPRVRKLRLRHLLLAIPGIGKAKAFRILAIFEANPELRLQDFTYDRRRELARLTQLTLGDIGPTETTERKVEDMKMAEHIDRSVPLRINGIEAVRFIKRAYGLGDNLTGVGEFDLSDEVQSELRRIKGWIEMAQHDALESRLP